MKLSYALTIIFFCCLNSLFSQGSSRVFKGRAVDSATLKPLADASVCIYRASDTSLLNFGFTTPNGNFSLSTKNQDSLIIIVSLLGYDDHVIRKGVGEEWDFNEYGDIKLKLMPISFQGVSVRSSAIRMKGDTIEINASRFKVLPGSDVAQLFKKIPGFEVTVKGEVKVNGSPVTKIMVDGSDFFGNNPGMVSKNLSADMVETVQVYEDLNEDGSPKEKSSKVINLKLKKGKRNGTFGDIMAGYGTSNRYEGGLRLNNFKNDRKFSFILNGNNTNETGFDFGFENWHDSYTPDKNGGTTNDEFFVFSYGNNQEGNINNKLGSGITYFNEFSKKRKLSFNFFGNRNKYNSINMSKTFNPVNDSTQRSNLDSSVMNGLSYSGTFSAVYSKTIDSTGWFDCGLTSSLNNNRSTTDGLNVIRLNDVILNQGISSVLHTFDKKELGMNGNLRRMLRKDKRYMFIVNTSYKLRSYENNSFQFIQNTNDTFNNLSERSTANSELLVKLFGKIPIYKLLSFNLSADRWAQNNRSEQLARNAPNQFSSQFEQDYRERIDTLSSRLYNRIEQYTLKPSISLSSKHFYAALGVTQMQLHIRNQLPDSNIDFTTRYAKTLPYMFISYYPQNSYFYFTISKSTVFPTVQELLPTLNISNNYERQTGNRNLQPQDNYSFNAYSGFYKMKGFRYLYLSVNGSMSDNAKIWVNRQDENGIIVKTPENAPGKKDFGMWFNASKKLTKVISLDFRLSDNVNRTPLIINEQRAFGTNNSISCGTGLNFTKADSLDLSFGMHIDYNAYSNSLNESLNFRQNTYGYYLNIRALLKTGTELNTTLDISDQRNVPSIGRIIPVWNAYIQQPLTKNGKYNIKLTAYDILKRNTNITRTATDNYISITQSNRLQQYFMLTLIYKIKKVGGEEAPEYTY